MRSKKARPKPKSESAWMSVKSKEKGDPLHRPSFFPLFHSQRPLAPPRPRARFSPVPLSVPFLRVAALFRSIFSSPPDSASRSGRNSPTIAASAHDRRHCPPPTKKRKRVHASIPDAPKQTVDNRLLTKAPRPDGNKSPKRLGARRKPETWGDWRTRGDGRSWFRLDDKALPPRPAPAANQSAPERSRRQSDDAETICRPGR